MGTWWRFLHASCTRFSTFQQMTKICLNWEFFAFDEISFQVWKLSIVKIFLVVNHKYTQFVSSQKFFSSFTSHNCVWKNFQAPPKWAIFGGGGWHFCVRVVRRCFKTSRCKHLSVHPIILPPLITTSLKIFLCTYSLILAFRAKCII